MPRLCIAGHRHWSEYAGGVELQIRALGEVLHAAGWEVVYLCHSLRGRQGWEELAPGMSVYWLPVYPYGWSVPRKAIWRLLETIAPDVLYQRGWGVLQESGIVLEFARQHGIPYVFAISSDGSLRWRLPTVRTFLLHRRPRWRSWLLLPYALWADVRLRQTIRHASYVFVQHEEQLEWLRWRYARRGILVRTLHRELSRPAHKAPTPVVAWIHNYRPHAQLSIALRIAAEVASEGVECCLVTGVTRPAQLSELRQWGTLPPGVRLLGALRAEEAEQLLERAWILLHTGLYEGFPNTFVQAWLRETLVVSLWVDPGGTIRRHGLGFCAEGNLAALLDALRRLLHNHEERQRIGLQARLYAEQHHGLQHARGYLQRLFEGIVQRFPTEALANGWGSAQGS